MKNKESRKLQFGGWVKRAYREIRQLVKRRTEKDFDIKLGTQRTGSQTVSFHTGVDIKEAFEESDDVDNFINKITKE